MASSSRVSLVLDFHIVCELRLVKTPLDSSSQSVAATSLLRSYHNPTAAIGLLLTVCGLVMSHHLPPPHTPGNFSNDFRTEFWRKRLQKICCTYSHVTEGTFRNKLLRLYIVHVAPTVLNLLLILFSTTLLRDLLESRKLAYPSR